VAIDALQRRTGYSPTLREIQEATGSASVSNVHDRLVVLRDLGLVTWVEDSPRTLVITESGRRAL
jgi:SOS-response transcriptional repressor LexA